MLCGALSSQSVAASPPTTSGARHVHLCSALVYAPTASAFSAPGAIVHVPVPERAAWHTGLMPDMPMQVMGPPSDAHRAAALPDTMEVLAWSLKTTMLLIGHPGASASTADNVLMLQAAVVALSRPPAPTGMKSDGIDGVHGLQSCGFWPCICSSMGPGPSAPWAVCV